MKIIKVTCPTKSDQEDATTCFKTLKQNNPNIISVIHTPQEHILLEQSDYDEKGKVKPNQLRQQMKNSYNLKVFQ